MNLETLREYCLGKAGVTESFPFDSETLVLKVMGKMFALMPLEHGDQIALKCDPVRANELREEWEEITGAYHMNKTHWNTVKLNGRLSGQLIRELVDHSYELVVAGLKKADREALGRVSGN
jgi:predicted DNA-binding protein (MmcQ/YjbR family)